MRNCFCVALLLIAGCASSKVIPTRYFTVEPELHNDHADTVTRSATDPSQIQPAQPAPISTFTLGIRPLPAARPYDSRIAFRGPGNEIAYRGAEEWAEAPAEVITRAITDALASVNVFKDVGNAADMARPDLILTGEVRKFRENRALEVAAAEVEVRLELREAQGTAALWAGTLHVARPLADTSAAALAEAMNTAVAQLAREAAAAISGAVPRS